MDHLALLKKLAATKQTKLLGTAIGDMNGSKYEWWSIKSRDFEICGKSSDITGDTVMTLAVADALTRTIAELGYPNDSTADKTMAANASDATTDSYGNGAAMRIGAEGFLTKPVVPDELVAAVVIRAERMRTLRGLMARDSLTGLFNHTMTTQLLENALSLARRDSGVLSLVMIDIDGFKAVNDTWGHPAGDQVLMALSRVLQQRLRVSDIIGRYGGEEFAVILQNADPQQAARLIDALREDFARVDFYSGEHGFHCTFSAGVAQLHGSETSMDVLQRADKSMYLAKRSGKNRVMAA